MSDLQTAQTFLSLLLLKQGYVEIPESVLITDEKATIKYAHEQTHATITFRMILMPLAAEMMIYVQAPHLLSKIMSLKFTVITNPNGVRSALARGLLMTLFPPAAAAPSLPFVPEAPLMLISSYLTVSEAIALCNTNKRLHSFISGCSMLWKCFFKRDFPALNVEYHDEEWLQQYQANYKIKLMNLRTRRCLEREQYLRWSTTPPQAYPFSEFLHGTFAPPMPSIGDLWLPPQHLPFTQGAADMNRSPYAERYMTSRDTWF